MKRRDAPLAESRARFVAATPDEFEGVAFGAALGIFDADDGLTAVAWIAHQLLAAATVDAGEAEISRVARGAARCTRSGATPPGGPR